MEDHYLHLNTTSNVIKNKEIRNQIEVQLRAQLDKEIPSILDRMGEVSFFLTMEVGIYSKLLEEARKCYEYGQYHATISMVRITAERFCLELSEKMNFKINDILFKEEDVFDGRPIQKQYWRLDLLEKAKIIKPEICIKLKEIDQIGNKYIHPREVGDAKKDSLKTLNLFIEILNSRFSENYEIKEGRIIKKI